MVTVATVRALLVVFAPAGYDLSRLSRVLDTTSARMHQFTGSREVERFIEGAPLRELPGPPNG
jgi:hypothetical protein